MTTSSIPSSIAMDVEGSIGTGTGGCRSTAIRAHEDDIDGDDGPSHLPPAKSISPHCSLIPTPCPRITLTLLHPDTGLPLNPVDLRPWFKRKGVGEGMRRKGRGREGGDEGKVAHDGEGDDEDEVARPIVSKLIELPPTRRFGSS